MARVRTSRLKKGAAITGLAVALVGGFEGLRTSAYLDPVGIPTICFGETKNVRLGMKMTRAECGDLLVASLKRHEYGMRQCLRRPDDLSDKTYAAFLSFTYNVGVGAFCRSTLARKANAGDLRGACNELPKWVRAGGIKLRGLVNRRADERRLCLEGLAG